MRLLVPFVLACACGWAGSPALAANELGLSKDGTHWSADLASPLFSPNFRWIPGDHETRTFWVRNQSTDRARLDIVLEGESVQSLMQTGDLKLSVSTSSGGHGAAASAGQHELVSRVVEAGEKEKVNVTIDFDASSTNQSQVKSYEFHLDVRLTQDSTTGGGSDRDDDDGDSDDNGDDDDRNGILPGTGGPAWWILGAGVLGVSTGWLTVAAARRREAHDV